MVTPAIRMALIPSIPILLPFHFDSKPEKGPAFHFTVFTEYPQLLQMKGQVIHIEIECVVLKVITGKGNFLLQCKFIEVY